MIYSPNVPVFRADSGTLLEEVQLVTFLSSAAVNAGVVRNRESNPEEIIGKNMLDRMGRILKIAASNGHDTLILGAYGCGVFRNDTEDVAKWWKKLLDTDFKNCFKLVIFAIKDKSDDKVKIFKQYFSST